MLVAIIPTKKKENLLFYRLNNNIQDMQKYLFKNIQVVNEGKIQSLDVLINDERDGLQK